MKLPKIPLLEDPLLKESAGEESGMFPTLLPSYLIRMIGWVLISIFVIAVIGSVTVRIPQTVRCPFVLLPATGLDSVESPASGVVEQVAVREGDVVQAGDVLYVIRSEEVLDRALSLEQNLANARGEEIAFALEAESRQNAEQLSLQQLIDRESQLSLEVDKAREQNRISQEHFEASRAIEESMVSQYVEEVEFRQANLEPYRSVLERMRELWRNGMVSEVNILGQEMATMRAELDLQVAEGQLERAKLSLQRLKANREKERAEEEIALKKLEDELSQVRFQVGQLRKQIQNQLAARDEREGLLRSNLEKTERRLSSLSKGLESEANLFRVTAPYGGAVVSLGSRHAGDVVTYGQELCQIARPDSELRAEVTLPEESIGKVEPEQPVKLFVNAFPYQRYGAVYGHVSWVSPAASPGADGVNFQALVRLSSMTVGAGDNEQLLRPGMRGEAQIVTDRRLLIDYAIGPLRQLKENVSSPPESSGP